MLQIINELTEKYKNLTDRCIRKEKGQFFTSPQIATKMAELACIHQPTVHILEPGAGNGILSAALIQLLCQNCKKIQLTLVETDHNVLPLLKDALQLMEEYCFSHSVEFTYSIISENFILWESNSTFDIVICNPPYKKIRKDSVESCKMEKFVHGQPNIYALFMVKALQLLKRNGRFVFITPRSWTSGSYFQNMRKYILSNLDITDVYQFCGRDQIFDGEKVLQETIIVAGNKNTFQQKYINFRIYKDGEMDNFKGFKTTSSAVKNTKSYFLLPSSKDDISVINELNSIPDTFLSLGYIFKTGPVVEFRNKELLHTEYHLQDISMIRSVHIFKGEFQFPIDTPKAQYIVPGNPSLLLPNQNMILVRRLSAKEDKRRIQSCIYKATKEKYISIENHVNYLVRSDGKPLSEEEMVYINETLSSEEYDRYFRLINGSTQVNASELNSLPLRRTQ